MTKLPEVKTIAKARALSLIKWKKVRVLSGRVFNELDSACGFCYLGRGRATEKAHWDKCAHCGVDKQCEKILKKGNKLEEKLFELIDETITFLQDMDVTEK